MIALNLLKQHLKYERMLYLDKYFYFVSKELGQSRNDLRYNFLLSLYLEVYKLIKSHRKVSHYYSSCHSFQYTRHRVSLLLNKI